MMEDVNADCKKFCTEWAEFQKVTRVLVKALRRIHHGIRVEHAKLRGEIKTASIRAKILARHEVAFKKVVVGLNDYSENFLEMEKQYRELCKSSSKYCKIHFSRVSERYGQVTVQRDIVLYSIECIIRAQLRIISGNFAENSDDLQDASIFDIIGIFNDMLIKLKKNLPFPEEEEEEYEDEEDEENRDMYKKVVPENLIPPLSCLKQMTASKILQVIGRERAPRVTACIADTLMLEFEMPSENGTLLPWKPINYNAITRVTQGDIFEDAIAKEEDENKLNQQKLDLALRMEFGEDFPGTDYLPANDAGELRKPVFNEKSQLLNKSQY